MDCSTPMLPCFLSSSRACLGSCTLSQWCHSTISSSVVPSAFAFNFSQHQGLSWWVVSLHQVVKVLEYFDWSTEASASVLPMNIQGWFPLGLIGLISLLSKGLSRVFSSTTIWKQHSSTLYFCVLKIAFMHLFLKILSNQCSYQALIDLMCSDFLQLLSTSFDIVYSFVVSKAWCSITRFVEMGKSRQRLIGSFRNGGKEAFKCHSEARSLVFFNICAAKESTGIWYFYKERVLWLIEQTLWI